MRAVTVFFTMLVLSFQTLGCGSQTSSPATAPAAAPAAAPTVPAGDPLPPSEQGALERLEKSPRHGEYVDVRLPSGGTPIRTWVVYPERKSKAGVVIVIHEVYGLSDWIRAVADQVAREGFIAVAPDLISGRGPGGGGTESVATRDEVVALVRGLTPDETAARLNAVHDYAVRLPASNGRSGTIGFCWGGARSFGYAAAQPALDGAIVYYGSSPEAAELARVAAPVLGHYAGDDARVNATVPPADAEMKRLGKRYEPHVYEGAGHGFLRQQEGREGANRAAAEKSWPLTVGFLKERLE